jgi:hypothetical protein
MEDKAPPRLDGPAVMDRAIRRLSRFDLELLEERPEAHSGTLVTDTDPDRSILVMDADCDHRPFETGVGHSGHRKQQLARQETRLVHSDCFDTHGGCPQALSIDRSRL